LQVQIEPGPIPPLCKIRLPQDGSAVSFAAHPNVATPAGQLEFRSALLENYWLTLHQAQHIYNTLFGSTVSEFPASLIACDDAPIDQYLWLDSRCLEGYEISALRRAGYPVASRVSKLMLLHVPAVIGFLAMRTQAA
jgi:hypothetical protein